MISRNTRQIYQILLLSWTFGKTQLQNFMMVFSSLGVSTKVRTNKTVAVSKWGHFWSGGFIEEGVFSHNQVVEDSEGIPNGNQIKHHFPRGSSCFHVRNGQ